MGRKTLLETLPSSRRSEWQGERAPHSHKTKTLARDDRTNAMIIFLYRSLRAQQAKGVEASNLAFCLSFCFWRKFEGGSLSLRTKWSGVTWQSYLSNRGDGRALLETPLKDFKGEISHFVRNNKVRDCFVGKRHAFSQWQKRKRRDCFGRFTYMQ